jgi:hypothetical protein
MARTAAADTPDLVMRVGLCCDADRNGEVQAVTLAPQPPIVPFVIGCTRRDQTQQPTVGLPVNQSFMSSRWLVSDFIMLHLKRSRLAPGDGMVVQWCGATVVHWQSGELVEQFSGALW